jgi:hypothetical protein
MTPAQSGPSVSAVDFEIRSRDAADEPGRVARALRRGNDLPRCRGCDRQFKPQRTMRCHWRPGWRETGEPIRHRFTAQRSIEVDVAFDARGYRLVLAEPFLQQFIGWFANCEPRAVVAKLGFSWRKR